jgi:hypothetical protein
VKSYDTYFILFRVKKPQSLNYSWKERAKKWSTLIEASERLTIPADKPAISKLQAHSEHLLSEQRE